MTRHLTAACRTITPAVILLGVSLQARAAEITAFPETITLAGTRAEQQFVVTGPSTPETVRDLTRQARYTVQPPGIAEVSPTGKMTPKGNGSGVVLVEADGQQVRIPITVRGMDGPDPVEFATQVIPALSKAGCNQGACHGTPTGKNGFRLSLRGYLPDQDYDSLTRDMEGRRLSRTSPAASLILLKATGAVPHEGGKRFDRGSHLYRLLHDWIAEGTRSAPPERPRLTRIEVLPQQRVLDLAGAGQQLAVTAVFADGSRRDVTSLARFGVNDPENFEVTANGHVTARNMGEVTVTVNFLSEIAAARLTFLADVPGFTWKAPPERNFIDRHVFAKLRLLRIRPSELCADDEFLRRVYLDVCGILPTPDETRRFLADQSPEKRSRVINELLERPEYVDFWALKWADRLGCNNRFVGQRGAYLYHQWIREQVNANVPFDQFVRAVITADGPNYSAPAASFYRRVRDPQTRVEAVSQLFLGVRIGCARCHNHPFERWTQDDYYGLAAFFARVRYKDGPFFQQIYNKEETVWLDRQGEVTHPRTGQVMKPKPLGGPPPELPEGRDRREALAEWVTRPDNPFFARVAVNRVWHHLFGRGIVEPVDDFRDSNPPCNPELLDALAADFVSHGFDVKHTLRTILNSATYQLSAATNEFNDKDDVYFSHCRVRRLSAEQLLDAVCQVTGVPERFPGVPLGTRAAQLPDGETFHPMLKAFGRPPRAIECECEREADSTLEQALFLEAGRSIHDKLRSDQGVAAKLAASSLTPEALAEELFLTALCRHPSAEEKRIVAKKVAGAKDRRLALEDVLWALLNHREFLFQH
jgi:Protein of unknown function (DUF1553)/Protein of unknown function (DUF1549)